MIKKHWCTKLIPIINSTHHRSTIITTMIKLVKSSFCLSPTQKKFDKSTRPTGRHPWPVAPNKLACWATCRAELKQPANRSSISFYNPNKLKTCATLWTDRCRTITQHWSRNTATNTFRTCEENSHNISYPFWHEQYDIGRVTLDRDRYND